jgi:hypothetical protein
MKGASYKMKKMLLGLAAVLLCAAVLPVFAEDDALAATRPRPAIDVQLWARPRIVDPGDVVFIAGQVTNLGRLADKVRVSLSVRSRYFVARLGTWDFRLRAGQSARFGTRYRVPRGLPPETRLLFRAEAQSARGASGEDEIIVILRP